VVGVRARLGVDHPLFQTQYALLPLMGGGGLLHRRQLALLEGTHPRLQAPASILPGVRDDAVYVAGVDLAGEAEEGLREGPAGLEDALLRGRKPRQDSTVVTIARLDFSGASAALPEPRIEVVEHLWRTGVPHHQLLGELVALLRDVWRCRRVLVDATGVGAGIASFLVRSLGPTVVQPFVFTTQSKSRLSFGLLAAVNAGRLKLYAADGSPEYRECRWELERARSAFRANQTMNFFVDPAEGHDDFLMSLALAVEAAAGYVPRAPRLARGRPME
ncbi:MAG: hypothetical protein HY689_03570, partial [Chloroflexi bacterium]|nr:hypothetical protein [Chloroflexota bacterium]